MDYSFLAQDQTCPPEAPLREGECKCIDPALVFDLSKRQCVEPRPSSLTTRPSTRKSNTGLFIGILIAAAAGAALLVYMEPELAEKLVTP